MDDIIKILAEELGKKPEHIENVIKLIDEGNTIPFIARYRKELHGAMDDTSLRTLEKRLAYLRGLAERRETVKAAIAEQGKLTEELKKAIDAATTLVEVEDLYAPFKQKRRTRATIAKERDLSRWRMLSLPSTVTDPCPSRRRQSTLTRKRALTPPKPPSPVRAISSPRG